MCAGKRWILPQGKLSAMELLLLQRVLGYVHILFVVIYACPCYFLTSMLFCLLKL